MIDAGKYFTINRGRQYGKTTTLLALQNALNANYDVISLSFEGIGNDGFENEKTFVKEFCRQLKREIRAGAKIPQNIKNQIEDYFSRKDNNANLGDLFDTILDWCEEVPNGVVLFIDEVDSATNNQVFLDFLGCLRNGYIDRDTKNIKTFQSVILAGVTDIRHLKSKIRDDEQHKVNSPWNIAADFNVDMSLSEKGIKGMLDDYEADHRIGMDTSAIAHQIRQYTNGYPFLVSRICQIIDSTLSKDKFENLSQAWTEYGVDEAVKRILSENNNSLFESITGKLINYPNLKSKLRQILLQGEKLAWIPYDVEQQQLFIYGFIRNNHNTVAISNPIFEMLLYNHFIGETDENNDIRQQGSATKSIFVTKEGLLDVPKIMEHFIIEHNRIHKDNSEKFLEEEGRERFITYVSAIINGTGTYSVEEQTRDRRRMDLVIHYLGKRYVIEMKIWRGERYNAEGEKQIIDYLDYWNLNTGYLLSFNFNKNKESGVKRIEINGKTLFEGTV